MQEEPSPKLRGSFSYYFQNAFATFQQDFAEWNIILIICK